MERPTQGVDDGVDEEILERLRPKKRTSRLSEKWRKNVRSVSRPFGDLSDRGLIESALAVEFHRRLSQPP